MTPGLHWPLVFPIHAPLACCTAAGPMQDAMHRSSTAGDAVPSCQMLHKQPTCLCALAPPM